MADIYCLIVVEAGCHIKVAAGLVSSDLSPQLSMVILSL